MSDKSHDFIQDLLPEYCAGTLDGALVKAVEEHLEGCEGCREQVADWAQIAAGMQTLAGKRAHTAPAWHLPANLAPAGPAMLGQGASPAQRPYWLWLGLVATAFIFILANFASIRGLLSGNPSQNTASEHSVSEHPPRENRELNEQALPNQRTSDPISSGQQADNEDQEPLGAKENEIIERAPTAVGRLAEVKDLHSPPQGTPIVNPLNAPAIIATNTPTLHPTEVFVEITVAPSPVPTEIPTKIPPEAPTEAPAQPSTDVPTQEPKATEKPRDTEPAPPTPTATLMVMPSATPNYSYGRHLGNPWEHTWAGRTSARRNTGGR